MSALRDMCLSVGIVINFKSQEDKEFILENDTEKMKQQISNYAVKGKGNANKGGKGKKNQVQ